MDFVNRCFTFRIDKKGNVEIYVRARRKHIRNGGTGIAEHVSENIIEFYVGGKVILSAVFLTDRDVGKFVTVTVMSHNC